MSPMFWVVSFFSHGLFQTSGREPPHQHVCFLLLLSVSVLPVPSGQCSQLQRQPSLVKCLSGRRLARVFLPLVAWEKVRSALVRSLALEQRRPGSAPAARPLSPLPTLTFDSLFSYLSSQSFLLQNLHSLWATQFYNSVLQMLILH